MQSAVDCTEENPEVGCFINAPLFIAIISVIELSALEWIQFPLSIWFMAHASGLLKSE